MQKFQKLDLLIVTVLLKKFLTYAVIIGDFNHIRRKNMIYQLNWFFGYND